MWIVSLCHEIPPRGERLLWKKKCESGDYQALVEAPWGPLLVSVYGSFAGSVYGSICGGVMVSAGGGDRYYAGTVARSERGVQHEWALGRPALLADEGDSVEDLTLYLAEALVPTIRPAPRLSGSVLGFRGYTSPTLSKRTPWWGWDATRTPQCGYGCSRSPRWGCTCGFHASASAWSAAMYTRSSEQHVLVVAPFGRVIEHEEGLRCEHYDVLAAVYPLDVPAPDDPRVIRARNVPLRAWEVAQELLAASHLEEVLS